VLEKSSKHDAAVLTAQADLDVAQWQWENQTRSWIPAIKWNAPSMGQYTRGGEDNLWSGQAGIELDQKVPGGGTFSLQTNHTTAYQEKKSSWRQTPSLGASLRQPLWLGLELPAFDAGQALADNQRDLACESWRQALTQGLTQRIMLIRDFDLATTDLGVKEAQERATQAQKEYQANLTRQKRGNQFDEWKADRNHRSAASVVLAARYKLQSLTEDLTVILGTCPPPVTEKDRAWFLSWLSASPTSAEPADVTMARKTLEKLDFQRTLDQAQNAPVLTSSVSWTPNTTYQPFSKDWESSWNSLANMENIWTFTVGVGLSFSPDLVGKDANQAKIHEAERTKQQLVIRDGLERQSQKLTRLRSRITQLESYALQQDEELRQDAQSLNDLDTLYSQGQVAEVELLTARTASAALSQDRLATTWELIVLKLDLRNSQGQE